MSKHTKWFVGESEQPGQTGLYQRQIPNIDGFMFSRWDGQTWYMHSRDPKKAHATKVVSSYQNVPWRGLVEKQKTRREPSPVDYKPKRPKPNNNPLAGFTFSFS